MTVEPGFGGQSFMKNMIPKIERLRSLYPTKCIQVDGGIAIGEILESVAKAGANAIVAGSYVFRSSNVADTIHEFHSTLSKYF